MKKLILGIFLIFIIFAKAERSFSWDSTIAKYMPLQVGNVWVYYGETHTYPAYIGTSLNKYVVTGIADTLGKKYYRIQRNRYIISGNGGGYISYTLLRIDSVTMNLFDLLPGCAGSETRIDSLLSHINDSAKCMSSYRLCIDTSMHSIFSMSFSSKRYTNEWWNSYSRYLKGIGLESCGWGEAMNWSFENLRGCVINGVLYGDTNTIVGINQIGTEVPNDFKLSQNYPNPFNPSTNIRFEIPLSRGVDAEGGRGVLTKLIVYDALGREVQTLVNQELSPGTYEVDFDGSNLPSGVYYYKLEVRQAGSSTGSFLETKKMVLMK